MKRLSSGTWFLISLLLLALGVFFWIWGDRIRQQEKGEILIQPDIIITNGQIVLPKLGKSKYSLITQLQKDDLESTFSKSSKSKSSFSKFSKSFSKSESSILPDPRFPHRLRNTIKTPGELSRMETAILLNNASIDTASKFSLDIPQHLRAPQNTQSYLLQSAGSFDRIFDAESLRILEIRKIAYIPHNTWIVRMSPEKAAQVKGFAGTGALLPFEPYFKLDAQLLEFALTESDIAGTLTLRLTLFPDEEEAMFKALKRMGAEYIQEGISPFGRTMIVKSKRKHLSAIASLDGILTVERVAPRVLSNDRTRLRLGIDNAPINLMNTNFHELNGRDVWININDTGVDARHPDLANRVFSIDDANLRDPDGHGTHVAGTIASSGMHSPSLTNAIGSLTNANFHGMAPEANLFVLPIDLITGPLISDSFLQKQAAQYNYIDRGQTNAMISNNSWNFKGVREYNSSAASYDAAVRDALPEREGDQPILFVFSAGNEGAGNDAGQGGEPASISAPATAKNVITVGSLESLRFITNEVEIAEIDEITIDDEGMSETNNVKIFEPVFEAQTDSANQVSGFSARGNVGIGTEGDYGRFKPDVVAPGSFIISTASTNWTSPDQFLDVNVNTISNQMAIPESLTPYTLLAREGIVEIEIRIVPNAASPEILPRLPIYARYGEVATTADSIGFNRVRINEDASSPIPLQSGVLFFSIGNPTDTPIAFDIQTRLSLETRSDAYFDELKKLNEGIVPHYRFESGTSMAAPAVSGMLALFQEFFKKKGHNPSPALLKALLINGARTAGELYDFQVDGFINFQGWGAIHLTNSLPDNLADDLDFEGAASLKFLDQSPENALATGDHQSWNLDLTNEDARAIPLRLSLVWTDPPGNPSAGIKLVNDLDLIVSNTVSGEVFYGNDFAPGAIFSSATPTNDPPRWDNVNNVENIFLSPPLDANYVVSVIARRVNVNALSDHPDGVVQDFALVVSSGDNSSLETPFLMEPMDRIDFEYVEIPSVISITNSIPRLWDRVGANAPLLGTTNGLLPQWQFYTFTNLHPSTNDVGFTNGPNVAFVTFLPPNLARPRNLEADVDLFVSRDSNLTNLNPNVIENISDAWKSTMPGGSEVVILTNQPLGDDVIYYIGVKSEDHQGGQYAFVGISQEAPFDEEDANGNRILRGIPLNQGIIPDGSPNEPMAALTLALGNPLNGLTIQNATAELSLVHEDIGDLLGNINHDGVSIVLNNHTLLNPQGNFDSLNIVYDDFENLDPSSPSDGPGSLIDFVGQSGVGVWLMSMVDNALSHTGRVLGFNMILTPNRLNEGEEGVRGRVAPESFVYYPIEVPPDASALNVHLTEFDLPLDLYLRWEDLPTQTQFDKRALGTDETNHLTLRLTRTDIPPLNPGQYFAGIYNPHPVSVDFRIAFDLERRLLIDASQPYFAEELSVPIQDASITRSRIFVPDTRGVADVKVGLRIDHSRVSDLTMHLISPFGTRVLLSENRGGTDANGWGSGPADLATYGGFSDNPEDAEFPVKFAPPPYSTNASIPEVTLVSGFEEEAARSIFAAGETFLANAQSNVWEVLSGRAIIAGGNASLAYEGINYLNLGSARIATELTNEPGRKLDLFYSSRSGSGRGAPIGRIFLDGTRAQIVDGSFRWRRNSPVRFTPNRAETLLELAPVRGRPPMLIDHIELRDAPAVKYFFPEEELALFDGQSAVGDWTLEIWDNRAGATNPQPILHNWQLLMSLAQTNFPAVALSNGQCETNTLIGEEIHYYIVDVPRAATMATNQLNGSGDLILLWNEDGIPTEESDAFPPIDFGGEGEGEAMLLSTSGISIFSGDNWVGPFSMPVLSPGQRYYLGVKNADPNAQSDYELCVHFDKDDIQIITLTNAIAFTNTVPFTSEIEYQYYRYRAASDVLSMDIEIFPEDGDVNAVEKFGLPLPSLALFDHRAEEIGLMPERITITNRAPATIFEGDYYIGVYHSDPNQSDVQYSILVTETKAPYNIIRLPNGEPIDFVLEPNFNPNFNPNAAQTLQKNFLETLDAHFFFQNYFLISITNPLISQARIDLENLSASARVIVSKDDLPSLDQRDHSAFADPAFPGSGRIVIRTNALRPNLIGDWFFAILNEAPAPLAVSITGTTFSNNVPILDLTKGQWLTNTVVPNVAGEPREVDYYRFIVSENALDASFTLEPILGGEGDVDLRLRKELIPLEDAFDYESSMRGLDREFIALGAGSDAPLSSGEWLLAIYNNEENPVTYRIRADQNLDLSRFRLSEGMWITNTALPSAVGQLPLDLYEYEILPEAISATFELEPLVQNAPGNLDLLLRKGDPPDLIDFDFASINAGNASESITLDTASSPPIVSGSWFAGVINRETMPVLYRIRATQIVPPSGPPMRVIDPEIELIGGEICLNWDSIPNQEYFIQGKIRPDDPLWEILRGPIRSSQNRIRECFSGSIPYRFFRILFFEKMPMDEEFLDPEIDIDGDEVCLSWLADRGREYVIEGKFSLTDTDWQRIEMLIGEGEITRFCIPLPTDFRFLRIRIGDEKMVMDEEFLDPEIDIDGDEVCLSWQTDRGREYVIEGKFSLTDTDWQRIEMLIGEGEITRFCIPLPTDFRFLRIRIGEEKMVMDEEFLDPEIDIDTDEVCLSWQTDRGREYVIEGKFSLTDTDWQRIEMLIGEGEITRFCIPLPTDFRFLRIVKLARIEPFARPFLDSIIVNEGEVKLIWNAEAGRRFVVEFSDGIPLMWQRLGQVSSETGEYNFIDKQTSPNRFYRLRELQP